MTRLREEHGMALVVALLVMMITLLLAGVAVTVAVHTNSFANRDTGGKTALQAADAGLHVATYRLNVLRPDAGHCPTSPATTIGAGNLCAGVGPRASVTAPASSTGCRARWRRPTAAPGIRSATART